MKRVQPAEIEPGMRIKLGVKWVNVLSARDALPPVEPTAFRVITGRNHMESGDPFTVNLYPGGEGWELHPQRFEVPLETLANAKAVQRKGLADVQNIVLREYSIKLRRVDRVDNQGTPCGYCSGANRIVSNIYATVSDERGRTEESAWSSCVTCEIHSIDEVEDVDPSFTVTIERAVC